MAATGAVLVLLVAMALDTRVVRIGSGTDAQSGVFVPAAYGREEFPKVQAALDGRAVDAPVLADAIDKDADAAAKQYGLASSAGPEFAVKFTGTVGKPDESGICPVEVAGMPAAVHLAVQTGPAIIGTDLRDASGLVSFGQFRNQIEYQNAGAALNNAMKAAVLAKADPAALSGRTVEVVGAFQLSDPANWQVTPSRIVVR